MFEILMARWVWCVFDRDEHENVNVALDDARRNDISVGFSNPCFELWLLIHFEDQRAHIGRQDVVRKLRNYITGYEKSMENCHDLVYDFEDSAISRAENLRDWHRGNGNAETHNPSTTVDGLVKSLSSIKILS